MGKCETSTTSIGIKILLSDLVSQINEKNFDLIKEILNDGFISDSNEHYNDAYTEILWCNNDLPENYLEYKTFMEQEFKNKGSYLHVRNSNKIEPDLRNGCLFDKELLLPIKNILETERWGYDRYGRNGNYCPINFMTPTLNLEKYQEIEKYTIVLILEQYSG
jgi:hypothetical protein